MSYRLGQRVVVTPRETLHCTAWYGVVADYRPGSGWVHVRPTMPGVGWSDEALPIAVTCVKPVGPAGEGWN